MSPAPICNSDENHQVCGPSCETTCATINGTCSNKACPKRCVDGCFCKPGLVRSEDGVTCVKTENCGKLQCIGPNEHYERCPSVCPPQTCKAQLAKYDCSKFKKCCRPSCRCDKGYLRDEKGVCIPSKECSKV
ncbi:hypothetical protein JYU34_004111 [Plutella xylostella]|uniref:TIL domain-containing protein n=1 Tax=Plutella xylostella TaxID=51655 RepID=A0ABQ7QX61_PLUXY|nr:hypothetical protein JYU34_004111 [Plutella xylostella]